MTMLPSAVLLLCLLAGLAQCQQQQKEVEEELLNNPDFEAPFGADNWEGVGATLTRTDADSLDGQYSGHVTDRQANWGGVSQTVTLPAVDRDYYFTAHVRLLNHDPQEALWHEAVAMVRLDYQDGETVYRQVGVSPYLRGDRGWQQVGGDFYVQNKALSSARVYLQLPDVHVTYLVDAASLRLVPQDDDWRAAADARIEAVRKTDVALTVDCGSHAPADVEVDVTLARHEFGWGTAIVADRVSGNAAQDRRYQEVLYDNFEWAVFENAMKWKQMERVQYEINFDRVDNALTELLSRGMRVRGHCLFWGVEQWVTDWLLPLDGEQVRAELERRMDYMVDRYSDGIVHWDVNNEQLHGSFFEDKTSDWTLLGWMFQEVHQRDRDVTLFINDYNVVSGSSHTVALANSARELLADGAPIGGIGVQSHITGAVWPDLITRRLETLAGLGLPIWVTELDIDGIDDREERADQYERALRLYFSRPEVAGVLIWGFWDEAHWRPDAALWEGPDITPNAAGERWMALMREWRTDFVLRPTSSQETFDLRAFKGEYVVRVRVRGETLCTIEQSTKNAEWAVAVEEC